MTYFYIYRLLCPQTSLQKFLLRGDSKHRDTLIINVQKTRDCGVIGPQWDIRYHTSLTKQGSGNFSEEEMGEPEVVDDLKETMLLSTVGQLPMDSQGL